MLFREQLQQRYSVLVCSQWALASAGYQLGDLAVCVEANKVLQTTAAARTLGVTEGMSLREAQRLLPHLSVCHNDLASQARSFAKVLSVLERTVAEFEVLRFGSVAFLTKGPGRYFGGEEKMSARLIAEVQSLLQGLSWVSVGTSDSRFAASLAALEASRRYGSGLASTGAGAVGMAGDGAAFAKAAGGGGAEAEDCGSGQFAADNFILSQNNSYLVVPKGQAAEFCATYPLEALSHVLALSEPELSATKSTYFKEVLELIGTLKALGIMTLGAFAAIKTSDVTARFGRCGQQMHMYAKGIETRFSHMQGPQEELSVEQELEPPAEKIDRVAFSARALSERLFDLLEKRNLACERVLIGAVDESGQSQKRSWHKPGGFSAEQVSERMRWQLEGWLSGPYRIRPKGGLVKIWLAADETGKAAGAQLGLWGRRSEQAQSAARATARIQGLFGADSAFVLERSHGRSCDDAVLLKSASGLDLVERERLVRCQQELSTSSAVMQKQPSTSSLQRSFLKQNLSRGALPSPMPAKVLAESVAVQLLSIWGKPVVVSARGQLSEDPYECFIGDIGEEVLSWSAPWLLDEFWWEPDRKRRSARLQVVTGQGRALLLVSRSGEWFLEAIYD